MPTDLATFSRELDVLFSTWPAKLGYRRTFRDGPVYDHLYVNAPTRILFILKEVSEVHEDRRWDLHELIRKGKHWRTWNNVARWAQAIVRKATWDEVSAPLSEEDRVGFLASVAAINLNKEGGGRTSKAARLRDAAEQAKGFLREQVAILDPNVVVCCGDATGDIAGKVLFDVDFDQWANVAAGVWIAPKAAGPALITMPHPQARRPASQMFKGLMDALRVLGL